MTSAEYLAAILDEQQLTEDEVVALQDEQARISSAIASELSDASPDLQAAGSFAKGTLISTSYDLDVVCYFDNDDAAAGETLKDIFENVRGALETAYKVEPKKSALRLTGRSEGVTEPELEFEVDVVPGRFVDDAQEDVFLFQNEGEKNRLKTNLKAHVSHVQDSGLVDVVRLAKLWKLRTGLEVKTFVLELVVIEVLEASTEDTHDTNLVSLWTALRDDIDDIEIEDPANPSGNDLSEFFGDEEREALASAAALTLGLLEAEGWEAVFGELEEAGDDSQDAELVALADWSHRAEPPWPSRQTIYSVAVTGSYQTRRGGWSAELSSNKILVTERTWFRYRATTNVPEPFDVRWQVVNTGAHAKEVGGLRGREFSPSKGRGGSEPANKLETWEHAEYTGKHWIECFIVKGDEVWARSGPYYVNIVNRQRKGNRWFRPRSRRRR